MQYTNTAQYYGLISRLLHWSMAIAIIGLFFLGKYMVGLDYYDSWYKSAPDLHRSIGVIILLLMLLRWVWKLCNTQPVISGKHWEITSASWVHFIFYLLIPLVAVTGYLVTTADDQPLYVFNWFIIPATLSGIENQEDIAGAAHEILTNSFILLVILHATAALKHHFLDHDRTLLRMMGKAISKQSPKPTNNTKEKSK